MRRWPIIAGVLIVLVAVSAVWAGEALDTVKANVNSVLDVLKDPKLKGEAGKKMKEQRVEAAADKLFDWVELSKRTLGLNWNKFSMEQRKEFVELYKKVLKDAYVDKITSYTNEQVNFTKEIPVAANMAEVQSTVAAKGSQVNIFYRVMKKSNVWEVYDVIIEGVSLINNYRTQFREILGNNPPQALIDTLKNKTSGK